MKIDPKKIARMITEDPNEVVPSDHFDDFEDEYGVPGVVADCNNCGVEFNPWVPELSADNEEFGRIYDEVDRLSEILYTSGYFEWWFCSTTCAREQCGKLKIEIEHNS